MERLERFIIAAALGSAPPIAGLIIGWWGSIPFLPERWLWLPTLIGLVAGLAVDILWLRHWTRRAMNLDWRLWALVYGFYSVGIVGVFMGVPVFSVALALPAGIVVGSRLARSGRDIGAAAKSVRRACRFTTGVLAFVCATSAMIALMDPYTAENLEGMLGLPFQVTPAMTVGLILVGGAGLLIAQWWVTALSARWAYSRVSGGRRSLQAPQPNLPM